jgi:tetratricopeptide (TPR) repeat protein
MFALEYQLVGKSPWLGHMINILLYGFLCLMVYKLLISLICHKDDSESKRYMVLAVALIYAAHPLHTEAVANIKGRDEIMSMLGSILAMFAMIKYVDLKQSKYLGLGCISFFIAFLSKENTITFLAVIPLALYYFRDMSLKVAVMKSAVLLIPTILFLMIRATILGNDFGGTPMELMNNPFLKLADGIYIPFDPGEKIATIMYTLGKYVQLLVFPHPLTHDYYPRYIDIMHFDDIGVIMSVLLYAIIAFFALKGLKTRHIIGFASAYFLITLSIVSNIVFPIGTNMSERFMFMPSLGFALFAGYFMQRFVFEKMGKQMFYIILVTIISFYSIKTFTRNLVWESDYKLFTTDVKTSVNSAKVLNAAGGALTTEAVKEKNEVKKREMLIQAIEYLNQALLVHPTYKNAYLIMGNAYYYLKEYDKANLAYEKALNIDPNFKDAETNLAISLRDAGRQAGEVENNLEKSQSLLSKSYQLSPNDSETLRLLGVVNGIKGNHLEAVKYFTKVIEAEPKNASGYLNLSNAYRNAGDLINADKYMKTAIAIDPEVLKNQNQK